MIHLNNVSAAASNAFAASPANSADSSSLDSFENALSDAVAQTLQKFGMNPNSVNISISRTPTDTSSSAPVTPQATSAPPVTPPLGPFMNNSPSAGTVSSPSPHDVPAPQEIVQSFNDAYWSKQPADVQQLRTIGDTGERTLRATQLASQGFKIDVPIMVWGWDPSQVTSLRQSYGYTWVPSALQNPLAMAPGLSTPGMQSYDPNNPPTGSITV